jgi:hypothetical protein
MHITMLDAVTALEETLTAWHTRIPGLHRLAVIWRFLLALTFVPGSLEKAMGMRFMSLSASTTIGYFFEALSQSGAYWRFLCRAQLTTAALLLIPATSTVGAVLCFPIVLNIFIITVSLHFAGTPVITGMMLLASLFLLWWEYSRLAPMLWGRKPATAITAMHFAPHERAGFPLGAVRGLGGLLSAPGIGGTVLQRSVVAACLVGVFCVSAHRSPAHVSHHVT